MSETTPPDISSPEPNTAEAPEFSCAPPPPAPEPVVVSAAELGPPAKEIIARLRRRLWIERCVFLALLVVIAGVWLYPIVFPSVWAVYVDGRPVVAMRDRDAVLSVLEAVKRQGAGSSNGVAFQQQVRVRRTSPERVEITDAHTAAERVAAVVKLKAPRGVIYIDGTSVVALPTEAEANAVLDEMKAAFAGKLNAMDTAPTFKQRVEVRLEPAEQDAWADKDTALGLLRGEAISAVQQHTVRRGDTPASIAEQYELEPKELARLNRGVDLKHVRPGDKLAVSPGEPPLLTVVTEGRTTETLPTAFTVTTKTSPKLYVGKHIVKQPGKPGKQQVTYRVRCENGEVVHRDVLERKPLAPAREQIDVIGAKPRPHG